MGKALKPREQLTVEGAQQVLTALQRGSVPTPSFKPDFLLDQEYLQAIRSLAVRSIYGRWNRARQPSSLREIYHDVHRQILVFIETGQWPRGWQPPSKRTIDRRVNECADPRFWREGATPVIAVKAGFYMPSPQKFDAETRAEREAVVEKEGAK